MCNQREICLLTSEPVLGGQGSLGDFSRTKELRGTMPSPHPPATYLQTTRLSVGTEHGHGQHSLPNLLPLSPPETPPADASAPGPLPAQTHTKVLTPHAVPTLICPLVWSPPRAVPQAWQCTSGPEGASATPKRLLPQGEGKVTVHTRLWPQH